ncbi:glycoside hydrolase family 32 protein [Mesoplasma corruscae]|uniref:beta-fructofuranosidase n=1 Tax=Mesoplasma corruscae TaxID=216874 RepID=A0A2S5RGN1_9MOLU|nr:glycoside hydrolase family 32 protein [Mesoplasma corruscae]PPE06499.1 sucrose-6-phosphate hydrolase [Mesoplasma corruscae]
MWEKYSLINNSNLNEFEKKHETKMKDWYNNQFHLSGYSGSVNDPNGLVYYNNQYYIFLQSCLFSIEHYNKSWGLYTTKDFINYTYEGIVITPSCEWDKHGVFSGSAKVNKNGELEFFYTGNIKLDTINRTATTIKALVDLKEKIVTKELLFTADLTKYTGHFRDPIIFERDNNLYMLNGAQTLDIKGILSVYKFNNNKWEFFKDIELDKDDKQNSYMVECPNYFELNGKTIIFACFEKEGAIGTGSHFVKYLEVEFDKELNITSNNTLNKIDLGFDFYAPQIFDNTHNRKIMLGWLGNSKSNVFPPELTTWSNQLTVPRELFIKNNKLYQLPIKELEQLRVKTIDGKYENGTAELIGENINDQNFNIEIKSNSKSIVIQNLNNILTIDRSNVDYSDEENLPSILQFEDLKIQDIQILIDRSCMEIFINKGEHAISVRFYLKHHNEIITDLTNKKTYQLKGYEYSWNNIIFKNNIK